MGNEVGPVGGTVGIEHHCEDVAETRKEWEVPKLGKVDIAEITALTAFTTSDGSLSS
jgi:hypothetical protein